MREETEAEAAPGSGLPDNPEPESVRMPSGEKRKQNTPVSFSAAWKRLLFWICERLYKERRGP